MSNDRASELSSRPVTIRTVSNTVSVPNRKSSQEQYTGSQKKKEDEEEHKESEFMDRSAQLSASLNSLAMINAVKIIRKSGNKDICI